MHYEVIVLWTVHTAYSVPTAVAVDWGIEVLGTLTKMVSLV